LPLKDESVVTTGIVTALKNNGFFFQAPEGLRMTIPQSSIIENGVQW
jgi:hypothetical protein